MPFVSLAQGKGRVDYNLEVDKQQRRLDLYDGVEDNSVKMPSNSLTARAVKTYMSSIDSIQVYVNTQDPRLKTKNLRYLHTTLKEVNSKNYKFISRYERVFRLAGELVKPEYPGQVNLAKNELRYSLYLLKFINSKSYVEDFYLFASKHKPLEVLRNYNDWKNLKFKDKVLSEVAKNDPNAIKQYFGTSHGIYKVAKASQDPIILKLLEIYRANGSRSASSTNIHWLINGEKTLEESEALIQNDYKYFKELIKLKSKKDILGPYAVDETMEQLALRPVIKINDLHEASNENVRFAAVKNSSAQEIYTIMVYTPEEIYTSSFLGMYKRLMAKRKETSGYQFLEGLGFNKFRVFVRQCAGYNTLQSFLKTMTNEEVDAFIHMTVANLENTGGDLEPAVDVANIYGSLTDEVLRTQFRQKIEQELMKNKFNNNLHGMKVYGLLFKLTGESPEVIVGDAVTFDIPPMDLVLKEDMFPDGKNIQQHFFFDDEDGYASYASFVAGYRNSNWSIIDKSEYIIIKSRNGMDVEIYVNKPKKEYSAQPLLHKMFDESGRYPDIVVHRGHSYYVKTSIKSMTPFTKVAILGSCGGYHNISQAMENAEEVQIISSKQIGTMRVNNALLKEINEALRKGESLVWETLWKRIAAKLKGDLKFKEYIPPHKNLGAVFIRAFNEL
jgi:hypothetical protein